MRNHEEQELVEEFNSNSYCNLVVDFKEKELIKLKKMIKELAEDDTCEKS